MIHSLLADYQLHLKIPVTPQFPDVGKAQHVLGKAQTQAGAWGPRCLSLSMTWSQPLSSSIQNLNYKKRNHSQLPYHKQI